MKTILKSCLWLLLWLGFITPFFSPGYAAFTYDPSLDWYTLRTDHFLVHYHNGEEQLAHEAAEVAEKTYQRITGFFQWQPQSRTQIVLVDRMDFSNAFAVPIPRNTMTIIVTPPDDANDIDNYHDWLDLVITHEYTHIVHIDKATGTAKAARDIFGRQIFFFPNALQPPWVLEGIATYIESQIAPGIGRGQNSSFSALMRLEVESGIKPVSQVNQPMVSWPAGTTRYLYGVYFFNYLVETYGEQQVQSWFSDYSNNLIPFMVNTSTRNVFGKDLETLWAEFSGYLNEQFQPQIQDIQNKGLAEGERLTHFSYMTGYPHSTANGDVYFVKQDWLSKPALMVLPSDGKAPREIAEVYSGRFDVHPQAGALFAQIDLVDNVNYFSDLHRVDIKTGEVTQLTRGKRYKHAIWSPDAANIIAVQVKGGNSALHLLNAQGEYIKTLWQGNNHAIISEIDWSPDGKQLVASVWRPETRWNLETFDISTMSWRQLTNTAAIEFDPRFTGNGDTVIYSADYDGVFNLYQMNFQTREVKQLSNVMGSALSAGYSEATNGVYYMGQHAQGTDVYFLPQQQFFNKPVKLDEQPAPYPAPPQADNRINIDIASTAPYSALDKITPTAWFPYIEITDERSEFGINTFGSDPLNWHQYILTLGYDADNNWGLGWFDYRYDRWRTAFKFYVERDVVAVLDSQDKLNSYRDSDTLTLEALLPFLTRDRQWTFHLGASVNQQSDKQVEFNGIPLPAFRDELVGAAVTFNSASYFPRGISLEDGVKWRVVAEDSDALDSDFSGQVYTIDWRGYFSLGSKHVLATRIVHGQGTESPNPFHLGGTTDGFFLSSPGSSLTEPTDQVFNKRQYALRGYPEGLNSLIGDHMTVGNIEWRFPLLLLERGIMAPPLGIHQLHGSLFYSAGDAWYDEIESADYLSSAGIELNVELVFGYFIPINVRMGYAHGFDEGGDDEYYLKAGFTF